MVVYVLKVLLFVAVTLPWLSLVIAVSLFSRFLGHHLYRAWARIGLWLFGVTLIIVDENQTQPGPAVFLMLNQDSLLELFLLPAMLPKPVDYLINLEYALLPWIGWTAWAAANLVVIRQWRAQSRRVFARAARKLQLGHSVGVSIEGRRSADGRLSPYRKGPVLLAINSQVPIVPFIIRGAAQLLPPGSCRIRPGKVEILMKRAIETAHLTYADRDRLVSELRTMAEQALT